MHFEVALDVGDGAQGQAPFQLADSAWAEAPREAVDCLFVEPFAQPSKLHPTAQCLTRGKQQSIMV